MTLERDFSKRECICYIVVLQEAAATMQPKSQSDILREVYFKPKPMWLYIYDENHTGLSKLLHKIDKEKKRREEVERKDDGGRALIEKTLVDLDEKYKSKREEYYEEKEKVKMALCAAEAIERGERRVVQQAFMKEKESRKRRKAANKKPTL